MLTAEQKRQVTEEFRQLMRECEGFDDAMQYVGDIASDNNLALEEVVKFLREEWRK